MFLITGSGIGTISAQTIPGNIEFSSIKVDELSDQQVRQFMARAKSMGMSMQELEAEAIKRGMPYSEVAKLRQRIQEMDKTSDRPARNQTDRSRRVTDEDFLSFKETDSLWIELPDTILKVFGYDLFRRENLSFEPSLNIPTPSNYRLGAGDALLVEVWGASQQSYDLTVSPEGQIRISNLGPITVSGLTVEKASELIIQRLSTIYSGLRGANANTFAQVSVGNVRSIKVTIAGDAYMPGTFTLPAFATAFNALYLAGGPSERGSFRDIRIIRGGSEIARLDLYDFLVKGETSLNLRLQDEDLIFVGPYRNQAALSGEVIRPAIYELKENETLADLIAYAGGFTASAYTKRLQVDRKTDSRRKLLNVENELYSSFLMKAGDEIEVGEILELYENRVSIQGAVHREGYYSLTEGMTVKKLIQQAEGLREDAFTFRAALYRQKDNLEIQVIDLNLHEIMQNTAPDVVLQKEDLLMVSSVLELQQERKVQIIGEVQQPAEFPWAEGITLGEVIRLAGGLNDAASLARVEVARRINNRTATTPSLATSEIFSFPLDANLTLKDQAASFVLQPFDMIFVRRSPAYQTQQLVQVNGEVVFPGSYAVSGKREYISDLINVQVVFPNKPISPVQHLYVALKNLPPTGAGIWKHSKKAAWNSLLRWRTQYFNTLASTWKEFSKNQNLITT
jgi:protein involved in polysaccharide export with SLBB domain